MRPPVKLEELENLIDTHGLPNVLQALVAVCRTTATRLRNEYNAYSSEWVWTNIATQVANAEDFARKEGLQ